MLAILAIFYTFCSLSMEEVYFHESFDKPYVDRWTENVKDNAGKFVAARPKHSTNETDQKLKTPTDARFYHIAAKFDKELDTSKSTVVIQFTVQFEQDIDCGGGYVKVLPVGSDISNFDGDTKYAIMFGPDVCGYDKKMVHAILTHKDKNHLISDKISFSADTKPHIFTFILRPDKTYQVLVDGSSKKSGKVIEDWPILPPKTIPDPQDKKPETWVDQKEIPDPDDKKPDDWEQPETIVDTKAKKPEDWNEEEDGEWTAPMIANPDYKGEWNAKMIPNPKYVGEWVQKTIPNPDYQLDDTIAHYKLGAIGIDVWQVKSGTLFDDIVVTDSEEEAKEFAKEVQTRIDELNKQIDENKKKEEEEKKKEEEIKKKAESEKKKEEEPKKTTESENEFESDEDESISDAKKHDEL